MTRYTSAATPERRPFAQPTLPIPGRPAQGRCPKWTSADGALARSDLGGYAPEPMPKGKATARQGRRRANGFLSGGVQRGISNGETIYFRVAFKPTATIMRSQHTVTVAHEDTTIQGRGRHDPCVLPRAVPRVEAMAALVLADHMLRQGDSLTGHRS
jgi:Chorismate synthase